MRTTRHMQTQLRVPANGCGQCELGKAKQCVLGKVTCQYVLGKGVTQYGLGKVAL